MDAAYIVMVNLSSDMYSLSQIMLTFALKTLKTDCLCNIAKKGHIDKKALAKFLFWKIANLQSIQELSRCSRVCVDFNLSMDTRCLAIPPKHRLSYWSTLFYCPYSRPIWTEKSLKNKNINNIL